MFENAGCRVDGAAGYVSPCRTCGHHFEVGEDVESKAILPRGGCGFDGGCGRLERYQAGVRRGTHAGRYSIGGSGHVRRTERDVRKTGTGRSREIDARALALGFADRFQWAADIYREMRDCEPIICHLNLKK